MNYYPFNVGDYAVHTAHLEPMEDLAYRRLLDQYYLREGPLPSDIQATAKLVRMRSMAADVEAVLKEFFVLTGDGWRHSRCDCEIERMQDRQAQSEAKALHETERMRRHRERRSELFAGLRAVNVVPAWDVPIRELQRLYEEHCNGPETDLQREQVVTCNAPATAIPTPTPTPTPTVNLKEQGAAKATRFDPLSIELGCIQAEAWGRWIAYRRSRKLTNTEATVKAQAASLNAWAADGYAPELVIDTSIEKGWQGLFKPKDTQPNAPPRMSASDASKLAAARTIFGTEIEGNGHGNIIDSSAVAVGRENFSRVAGQLR